MKILSVLKTLFPLAVVWASSCIAMTTNADLIITEFLANPFAVDDDEGEYFELFNSGSSAIDIGTLTILDDGADSIVLSSFGGTLINPGDFVVFGNNSDPHVDINYDTVGSFILANGADGIIVIDTASETELARLNYLDGDDAGPGIALVLDDTANATNGVTLEANYIAEIPSNDTLPGTDVGSPGVAGSTIITAIPEPTSLTLLGGLAFGLFVRRRR